MRDIIIRICHWLLAAMGLAGAFACDGGGLSFIGRDEYGTPHCTYEVKCRVVDSESAEIVNACMMILNLTGLLGFRRELSRIATFDPKKLQKNPS